MKKETVSNKNILVSSLIQFSTFYDVEVKPEIEYIVGTKKIKQFNFIQI